MSSGLAQGILLLVVDNKQTGSGLAEDILLPVVDKEESDFGSMEKNILCPAVGMARDLLGCCLKSLGVAEEGMVQNLPGLAEGIQGFGEGVGEGRSDCTGSMQGKASYQAAAGMVLAAVPHRIVSAHRMTLIPTPTSADLIFQP